ncbi:MAG: SH3 domain-containing protein [Pseudomonadota bacterium]
MSISRFLAALIIVTGFVVSLLLDPVSAQNRTLPYWASLRFEEVNMRVGPSQDYRIDWVYKRKGLPVKVVRMREGWRLVQDPEGTQGWIAASQLTPSRGVLVIGEGLAVLRDQPEPQAKVLWRAQPGVVAQLRECRAEWCNIDVAGRRGWVARARLWGADPLSGED